MAVTDLASFVFDAADLQTAISSVNPGRFDGKACDNHTRLFGKPGEDDKGRAPAERFLSIICGFKLAPEDTSIPIQPAFTGVGWNCHEIQHVSEPQLDVVSAVAPTVPVADLRARLADICWIRRRDHKYARIAAEAYIESAECLFLLGESLDFKSRLLRSLQLSVSLGKNGELLKQITARAMKIAETNGISNPTLAECVRAFLRTRTGDFVILREIILRKIRDIVEQSPNPIWERGFWELLSSIESALGNKVGRIAALMEVAKTYEAEASTSPNSTVAAHRLQMAVAAYRQVPGAKEDEARVHAEYLQKLDDLKHEFFEGDCESLDLSDCADAARERVRGKPKQIAMAELVIARTALPNKSEIKKSAIQAFKDYPLSHLFDETQYGSTWKVAATAPAAGGVEAECGLLHARMCKQVVQLTSIIAVGVIDPLREQLLLEHFVTIEDVAEFVHNSPYVPIGREVFFTIGLFAGLQGRLVEANHVLLPQLEHLLRCLLTVRGVITSSLSEDGTQEEFEINRLLSLPQAEKALGENLCFTLRVLLTDRHGGNFRNELAHGMLSPQQLLGPTSTYVWWLIFWMTCRPYADFLLGNGPDSEQDQK